MPEAQPAAPAAAAPATPAPAADAPVVRKGPPRASEYLTEAVQAQEKAGGVGGGEGVKTDPPKTEEAALETRITKLASERRAVDAEKAALKAEREKFTAEQNDALQDASTMRKLREAKTKGAVLDVLKGLGWTQEQIDTDVYNTLSRDILAREPGEALTHKDVEEMVDARVKAEREAEAKKAETEKTTREETVRSNFLAHVDAAFDPAKYPALAKQKATKAEVLDFVNEHYDKEGDVPTPEVIHTHFDKKRRDDARAILFLESGGKPPEAGVPAMVGNSMKSGALPDGRDYSKLSRAERWELDKREAGIT